MLCLEVWGMKFLKDKNLSVSLGHSLCRSCRLAISQTIICTQTTNWWWCNLVKFITIMFCVCVLCYGHWMAIWLDNFSEFSLWNLPLFFSLLKKPAYFSSLQQSHFLVILQACQNILRARNLMQKFEMKKPEGKLAENINIICLASLFNVLQNCQFKWALRRNW